MRRLWTVVKGAPVNPFCVFQTLPIPTNGLTGARMRATFWINDRANSRVSDRSHFSPQLPFPQRLSSGLSARKSARIPKRVPHEELFLFAAENAARPVNAQGQGPGLPAFFFLAFARKELRRSVRAAGLSLSEIAKLGSERNPNGSSRTLFQKPRTLVLSRSGMKTG
jgi:hypothetical protein